MIAKTGKEDRGVTLIELMIVLVIAAILVGGIYTLFMTQQRSYSVQDQVAGAQQDARAALNIMARDIRMAGSLLGSEGFDVNGAQFAVTPNNNAGGTDSITVAHAAEEFISGGNPVTVTNVDVTARKVTLSATTDTDPLFFDLEKKKYLTFEGKDQVYEIYNGTGTATLTLTESPPSYIENVGTKVYRAKSITYLVQDNALRRRENGGDAQPLAGDGITTVVEDLQFAYQVEGSDTWIFDPNPAHTWPAGSTNADIRMVRINITVRTAVQDAAVQDAAPSAQFNQPELEDHTAGLNGPDGFRRRVYTTEVKVRNLK